jgi:Lrp/AsnC family transcriptional regulator, regulator for asnA, asnC and gidA
MSIDKVERQIILLLQENARRSYVDIAEKIGVTEGTIRRKVKRLVSDGIIKIAAVANPHAVGFNTPAIISIKADSDKVMSVATQLQQLKGVRFVALTTGSFDIIVEGYWANNRELANFLTIELAKVSGIREYSTALILQILKQAYDWGLPGTGDEEEQALPIA